jgi:hypothetical protein
MIDLNKSIEEISVDTNEEYLKALELLDTKVMDATSPEGKKIEKLVIEVNRYHNSEDYKKLNPTNWLNRDERLNVKIKKFTII